MINRKIFLRYSSFELIRKYPTKVSGKNRNKNKNMGDKMIERSGFGDELNYVPTDKNTLQTTVKDNIFAIGDATNLPASKAGSVAHFEAEILTENIKGFMLTHQ